MCFLLGSGAMISIICLLLRTPILSLMNTPPEAFSEANAYATVTLTGLIFIYGYNVMSAVLRGMGDSIRPFIFIAIAAVGNIVLDILFVIGLGMGSEGAALATVISQAFSFIACSVYIYRNKQRYELTLTRDELLGIDKDMLQSLIKLGTPMAIKYASIHLSKMFVNAYVNSYGVAVSAFAGIANKMSSIVNTLSNSFNTAGASMIGQNIGAGNYDRVGKIMKSDYSITVSLATVFSLLIFLFPKEFYGLFTSEPDVIEIGVKFVPIAIVLFYGSAARSGMNALINGSGNYKVNFATAILDGIVFRIGFALLFGLGLGMKHYGFWLGDALAGFTPLWIGLVFYYSGAWKKRSV